MISLRVRVPATSANLGPGFDAFGLALNVCDEIQVRIAPATRVTVQGQGCGEVGQGEDHLVVRAIRRGIAASGGEQPPGLALACDNAIAHGRGLGSSAAAVVSGLVAGQFLARGEIDRAQLLALATEWEGHPDNAAAAIYGGFTIAWCDDDGPQAIQLPVAPDVAALVLVPRERLATALARAVLPATVPHADAAFTAGRAALLTVALTSRPDLLLSATEDRLHQAQRASAMPDSWALVTALRGAGIAAVVSGAGPSVLVLCPRENFEAVRARVAGLLTESWQLLSSQIAPAGVAFSVDD